MLLGQRPFGLCAYGVPYLCGFAGRGTPRANPAPLGLMELVDLAASHRLRWLEVPPAMVSPELEQPLVEAAAAGGLELVVAGPRISEVPLDEAIHLAARLGARVVRCTATGVLCGDRHRHTTDWAPLLRTLASRLREAGHLAADHGLVIGVENHQDLTSDEILHLAYLSGPAVGITLDTGNALAVAEDPLIFFETVWPEVVNIHLKDYQLSPCEDGYRLVHCAIGDGVVPFGALFERLAARPELPRSIELAAMGERRIRWLEPEWWHGYGPRDGQQLAALVRTARDAVPPEDWRTPWDRDELAGLADWERARFEKSVENLAALGHTGEGA